MGAFTQYGAVSAPSGDLQNITPNDAVRGDWSALLVTETGNLTIETEAGTTVLLTGVPAWFLLPVRVARVLAATTATVVGLKD